MRTCPDENVLSAFAARRLPSGARAEVEAHLDACADCLNIVAYLVERSATAESRSVRAVATREGSELPAGPLAGATATPADDTEGAVGGPTLRAGDLVGRYVVQAILGEGGMGTVYVAHDPELDRQVALKVLRADRATGPDVRARLSREARTMARLAHPNIVTVYDAGAVDGRFHIAMELVDGSTLSAWLRAATRSTEEILAVFRSAGRALSAAHAAGVVHRDFKPDNVLIDRGARVVVTDFGIASSGEARSPDGGAPPAGGPALPGLTRTGTILGTPRYMAPEQHAGARVDARADQWSFAVSLYEALHDVAPFGGADLAELRRSIAEHRFAEPQEPPRRKVPPRVRAALLRALAQRPEERFPDVDALLAALDAPRWSRRSRGLAFGAALLAGIAVAASLFARPRPPVSAPAVALAHPPEATFDAVGRRPMVVVQPFVNRSGDPRLEGVFEAVLVTALAASRKLDAFSGEQVLTRAASLVAPDGVTGAATDHELAERDGRRRVTIEGEVRREGAAVVVAVAAKRLDTGALVLADQAEAPTDASIVPAALDLVGRLRAALGDPPSSAGEQLRYSSSLVALHAWAEGRRLGFAGGDPEPALRRAVAADPHFGLAHAALGSMLALVQQTPEAARELRLALANGEGMGQRQRLTALAGAYAAEGRAAESIAASEELLSLWPGDLVAESSVTATAMNAHYWPLALELSRRAVADNPRGDVVSANLLLALLGNGEIDAAAAAGDRDLAELSRVTGVGYAATALAHALRGDRARALAVYDELAKRDAELADEGRADLAIYEGRLDDAEHLLQGRIDGALRRGAADEARTEYCSLALVKLRRGDLRGALVSGHAALGDGGLVNAQIVAAILVQAGDEAPSRELARSAADRPSAEWRVHGKLAEGNILLHRGNLRQARAAYEAAGIIEDLWQVHAQLGETALREHRWEDAERELSVAFARRGEVAVTATPSLQLLVPILDGLARARARGK